MTVPLPRSVGVAGRWKPIRNGKIYHRIISTTDMHFVDLTVS